MQIDRIELFHVAMPLIYPWRTAYGEDAAIHSVLCRMTSGSVHAWGEATPFAAPCYSPDFSGAVYQINRDWLGPAVIGQNISSGAELQQKLSMFKGNSFGRAVLDTAWWNLESRITGKPLHELLGGTQTDVVVGADFGVMDDVAELLPLVDEAVSAGFPRIKLKFRPGWDLPMLRAVRQQHPDFTFHIDCNSGYRLTDLPLFQEVDELNLAMIEQPLAHDDVLDHSKLQKQITTPVCLDESIKDPRHVQQAIELGSCRIVNIKPGRVGGLTNALAIHNLCRDAGIPCWVGGMLESAVGASLCVSLATLDNFTYPADIFPSSRFYTEDLAEPFLELERTADGTPMIRAAEHQPEPNSGRLEQLLLEKCVINP